MSLKPEEPATPEDIGRVEAGKVNAAAAQAEPADAAFEEVATVTEAVVRVQRSPRYFRFMLAGAIVFAIVALILTFAFPENPTYDRGAVFGFLLAICATIGVALGAVIALLVDRATSRRARTVQADRIDVRVGTPDTVGADAADSRAADSRAADAEAGAETQRPPTDS